MSDALTPDICVIGAGSGGLSVAAAAAAFGVPVVLIEKGKMGGDCLNYGCVPSKALIAAARRAELAHRAAPFGVTGLRANVDFAKVHDHIHGVIAAIAPNDSRERFTGLGVQVIEGAARFKDRRTVVVGDQEIKARRFVIAAGSAPAIPPIPGLDATPHLTNETVFDLKQCPAQLVVIGAGPVGLELAQAFRRLGADVTVLEIARPLAKDDPECAAVVLDQLTREGIKIRAGIEIVRAEPVPPKVRVVIRAGGAEEAIDGTHLLVAAGRRPNTEGLDLAAAGIKYGPRGIVVNRRLLTSNRRVFAIGDAIGAAAFTHVANYHAGIVIRRALFRLPAKVNEDVIPWVTYCDPELAQVGLTEEAARKRYRKVRIMRASFHDNDRAQAERETRGHVKVIATRKGVIVGATIVGAHAGELIATWALAVQQGLKVRALGELIVPYPTLAEAGKRAAIGYFTPDLTRPLLRRIIAFLRRFG
ncbi:MAG TPA: FAD-dependent oxidoreductase [Xanthobacteraceae bacterium]|nr:FAD-dependent oxidoreductase [Xanthobacteraceae bacterium]